MEQKCYFKYYGNTTVCYVRDKESGKKFKGVAVCRDGDEYKKDFGEVLARAKAVYHMRQDNANRLQSKVDEIEKSKACEQEVRKQLKYFTEKVQESFELIETLNREVDNN